MSIDVAIPGDRNVIKKESEDILKYKNLITEIQRMWNMKAKVITVIRGDWNHFIITHLHLRNIRRKREIKELQTTAVLGIAHTHTHTLWKVLM